MGDRKEEYRRWRNGVIKREEVFPIKRNSVRPFCIATTITGYTPYRFLWFLPKATDALAKGKVPYSLWFGKSEGDRRWRCGGGARNADPRWQQKTNDWPGLYCPRQRFAIADCPYSCSSFILKKKKKKLHLYIIIFVVYYSVWLLFSP